MNINKNSKLIFLFVIIALMLTGCGTRTHVTIDTGVWNPVIGICNYGYEFDDYDVETNGDRKDLIIHLIKKGDTNDREGTGE